MLATLGIAYSQPMYCQLHNTEWVILLISTGKVDYSRASHSREPFLISTRAMKRTVCSLHRSSIKLLQQEKLYHNILVQESSNLAYI